MGVLFSHRYLIGYLQWIYVYGVSLSRQTLFLIPMGHWIMDGNWCSGLAVLILFSDLMAGIANLHIHWSLPRLSCGISSFGAAAGSMLYIIPALVHTGGIQTSFFPLWRGNRKTQGMWRQRNARIRWNSWVLQHPPNVPGHTLWLGGMGTVPKCAAKPNAGKAVMCQLRLWWRKKCWLLWLLKILTLWCLDGQGLVNCATGWITGSVWCSTFRSYELTFRIWKSPCPSHIFKYALVLTVSATFLECKWVLVALLCCDGECQNFWGHVACLSGRSCLQL